MQYVSYSFGGKTVYGQTDRTNLEIETALPGVSDVVVQATPFASHLAPLVRSECTRRIADAIGSKTGSLSRQEGYLLRSVAAGRVLSPDEQSEQTWFDTINAWETAMIERADALIATLDDAFALDSKWPALPPGLAAFLDGF
jgi:hypothetical protein